MSAKNIPLKDRNREIVGYTTVDEDVYNHIIEHQYKLYLNHNYARIRVNHIQYLLHRYIYYHFYKNIEIKGEIVDHKDRDKLNNCIDNLRVLTATDNAYNRSKSKNASSQYYGVCYNKTKNIWECQFTINKKVVKYAYRIESHGAYHHDLLVEEYKLEHIAPMNNIEKPDGFILNNRKRRIHNLYLPVGVNKYGKKYYYKLQNKQYYGFDTPQEAEAERNRKIKEAKAKKIETILNTPIKRNKDNIAIIEAHNREKKVLSEILIDDDDYYTLMQYNWGMDRDGYLGTQTKNGKVRMHRFITNTTDPNIHVDHINGNTFDNRKQNLRLSDAERNSQNKSKVKSKNCTSQYIGVHYDITKDKWRASITHKSRGYNLGSYDTEIEAVRARDIRAKELNDTFNCHYKIQLLD